MYIYRKRLLQRRRVTPEVFAANDTFSQFNKLMEFRADLMWVAVSIANALKDSFHGTYEP